MYKVGRKILGWIGLLAALAAGLALVFGLVYPPGLRAAETVICPAGTTIVTNQNNLDALRRSSTAERYSQFCTGPKKLVNATTRWFAFIGGGLVLSGLCHFLRARLTPPPLLAPVV